MNRACTRRVHDPRRTGDATAKVIGIAALTVEDGKGTVASHLYHPAVVRLDRAARMHIMRGQRLRHPRAMLFP